MRVRRVAYFSHRMDSTFSCHNVQRIKFLYTLSRSDNARVSTRRCIRREGKKNTLRKHSSCVNRKITQEQCPFAVYLRCVQIHSKNEPEVSFPFAINLFETLRYQWYTFFFIQLRMHNSIIFINKVTRKLHLLKN